MQEEEPFVPGQLVHIGASFIEERNGKALVRLPNGSKSTVRLGAIRAIASEGLHLKRADTAEGEIVSYLSCGWQMEFDTRVEAEDIATTHASHCGQPSLDTAAKDGQVGYRSVGWASINVRADNDEVEIIANADGLLSLARLFEQMAQRIHDAHIHLTPTLQLAPDSRGLVIARKRDGVLPNGEPVTTNAHASDSEGEDA